MLIQTKKQLNKKFLINAFGGKCCLCGYNKCLAALSFHHRDPKDKKFNLSKFAGNSELTYEVLRELTKVVLLCSNCHAELHSGMHKDEIINIPSPEFEDLI